MHCFLLPLGIYLASLNLSAGAQNFVRELTPAQTKLLAEAVERRFKEIDKQFREEQETFYRENIALLISAASLSRHAEGGAEAEKAGKEAAIVLEGHKKATDPLILKMAILVLRLRHYRETGELLPSVPNMEELGRLIERPWKETTPLPPRELDLRALGRQIRRYDDTRLHAPASKRPETFGASPAIRRAGEKNASIGPRFELDAGKARPEINPIPELIKTLLSSQPRERAFAADELGKRGAVAEQAIPALRSALLDPDPRVRGSAVLALSRIPGLPPAVLEDIRRALNDGNQDVRFSARSALRQLGLSR